MSHAVSALSSARRSSHDRSIAEDHVCSRLMDPRAGGVMCAIPSKACSACALIGQVRLDRGRHLRAQHPQQSPDFSSSRFNWLAWLRAISWACSDRRHACLRIRGLGPGVTSASRVCNV